MKKIWVNKSDSFEAAGKFDKEYYLGMTSIERLEIVQFLRENNFKMDKSLKNESRKGLRRVFKIIEQA